jgi:cell wall-associated NlpC family hydrolase
LFHVEQFKNNLKLYYEERPGNAYNQQLIINANITDFEKTDNPKFGDLILISFLGITSHIGIYIDKNNFLHTTDKTNSVLDKVSKWERMFDSYYKVKK